MALVALDDILTMLLHCLPGHAIRKKKHRCWVVSGDLIFVGLPLGEHRDRGRRARNAEANAGHVRELASFFELDPDCVRGYFPNVGLRKPRAAQAADPQPQ